MVAIAFKGLARLAHRGLCSDYEQIWSREMLRHQGKAMSMAIDTSLGYNTLPIGVKTHGARRFFQLINN